MQDDHAFLPPLDQALAGRQRAVSWQALYESLSASNTAELRPQIEHILNIDQIRERLEFPFPALAPPVHETKVQFETLTAAIHTPASEPQQIAFDQIKDDALWLSQVANINQVSALRIALLEYQQRCRRELVTRWSREEVIGLKESVADSSKHALIDLVRDETDTTSLKDEDSRRKTLLRIHWQEETSSLQCSLAFAALAQPKDIQTWPKSSAGGSLPPPVTLGPMAESIWKAQCGRQDFIQSAISALRSALKTCSNPSLYTSVQSDDELLAQRTRHALDQITTVLKLLQLHFARSSASFADTSEVQIWYDFVDEHSFMVSLGNLQGDLESPAQVALGLVSVVSVAVLRIGPSIEYIRTQYQGQAIGLYPDLKQNCYLQNEQCLKSITTCLAAAASNSINHAGPAILAWSLIAQTLRITVLVSQEKESPNDADTAEDVPPASRRSSLRGANDKNTKGAALLSAITSVAPGNDIIQFLANVATNEMNVLAQLRHVIDILAAGLHSPLDGPNLTNTRLAIFSLVQNCPPFLTYNEELVGALLAALNHGQAANFSADGAMVYDTWPRQPASALKQDKAEFMPKVVQRYPFELTTFLECLRSVARSEAYIDDSGSALLGLFDSLQTFTIYVPPTFKTYELIPKSEADNAIRLDAPLPIFGEIRPKSFRSTLQTSKALAGPEWPYVIPAGTIGTVLRDERPLIVTFNFENSTLPFLGAFLSTISPERSLLNELYKISFDVGDAADVINFVNALLAAARSAKDQEAPALLLRQFGDMLPGDADFIRVVFDIFEDQLQKHMAQPGTEETISLLVHILKLFEQLLFICPERIWTFLARSSLLPADDSAGAIPAIVGNTECPAGVFNFLSASASLCGSLIGDLVRRATSQYKSRSRALARLGERATETGRTSTKSQGTILLSFTRVILDVLQTQPSWTFADPRERFRLLQSMLRALSSILSHEHGTENSQLFNTFGPAAASIAVAYLSEHTHHLPIQALTDIFVVGLSVLATGSSGFNTEVLSAAVDALAFATLLLRVGMLQKRSGAKLRQSLFESMPLLARLYAAHPALKLHVAELLTALVLYSSNSAQDPPSLLGPLSTEATKAFLWVLADVAAPLHDPQTEKSSWALLSAIVTGKQQWLAISLLTGSTPRERLKNSKTSSGSTSTSLIAYTLDELAKLPSMSPRRAVSMLSFLSNAQRHWNWISNSIDTHPTFLKGVTSWLAELSVERLAVQRHNDIEAPLRAATETTIAAFVAEILATLLHTVRGSSRKAHIKNTQQNLAYLRDHATSVDGYNHSLHTNLAKNFEQKFVGCSLDYFRRSALHPAEPGRDYFYDLNLASRVLGSASSWRREKGQGFEDEIARANVNFSLVDAQLALLKGWKTLALELSKDVDSDATLGQDLLKVVSQALQASINGTIPAKLFDNVCEIRAGLAFALLQRISKAESPPAELKTVSALAWDAIRASGLDFEVIEQSRDADYYRTLLQILFLSLQSHASTANTTSKQMNSLTKSANTTPVPITSFAVTVQEIMVKVVATNFRALCTAVHEASPASVVQSSDFVLITAILQTLLRIPVSELVERQLANTISSTQLIRYATSLYSWSDSLTPGDPIHGELSVIFLLSLSTMPMVAEQMAVEGVLTTLASANTSQPLRAAGAQPSGNKRSPTGPFDAPLRLHAIWSRGILPLVLNIVSAVGPGIAPEVSSFLNGFAAQLHRCEADLSTPLTPNAAGLGATHAQPSYRGCISLGLAAEAHSLALLSVVLGRLRDQAAALGLNALDVEELQLDDKGLLEAVQGLLRGRRGLRERIVPVGAREEGLARRTRKEGQGGVEGDGEESVLEGMVVAELKGVAECLSSQQ